MQPRLNTALKLAILAENRHPRFDLSYPELTYVPMMQLIELLKQQEFEVFVFSGSQQDFVRVVAADRFRIPELYASGNVVSLDYSNGQFVREDAFLEPDVSGAGKAEAIQYRLGRLPILAAGKHHR